MRPQPRTQRFAVVYDISDDRERRLVDKVLRGWGHRVQKSVFTVTTSRHGLQRLRSELEALGIAGSVLIFRLQAGMKPLAIGSPFIDQDQEMAYVF